MYVHLVISLVHEQRQNKVFFSILSGPVLFTVSISGLSSAVGVIRFSRLFLQRNPILLTFILFRKEIIHKGV